MKKSSRRWLLAIIIACAVVACTAFAAFSAKARAITSVLNEHWNPYHDPPEYISKYPYSRSARKLTVYIFLNNPSEEQLAEHICEIEKDWLLIPREQRARHLAPQILASYHDPHASK